MKPIEDLISRFRKFKFELEQVEKEEERRRKAPPPTPQHGYAGLDLTWFDLSHENTRSALRSSASLSQLLTAESNVPEPIPSDIRFERLIKALRVDIRAARVYLQHDAYPQAKAWGARVPKLEEAIARLEKLSQSADIQATFYLDDLFVEDGSGDFCLSCANEIISRTRTALMFSCLLLVRRHFKLAHALWNICEEGYWWELGWDEIYAHESYGGEESDRPATCDRCYTNLSYSLTRYGTDEEADRFLAYEGEMTPENWHELNMVFEGAKEQEWPNYLADKLDQLIEKYQLDSPRSSVMEEVCI